ncbi:MAG: LicD family protein [Lachnospiraceae bacterium]|jgi:lipopolysaccharide cholinephosphotransferase|nr:LicD family protein [Lachnospiraceae bacterium]
MSLRTGDLLMKLFKKSRKWKNLNSTELSQLKEELLTIADDFVKVCEKYNLNYFMAYGTALGAVRHKGFIPWDDDMDFCMPRKDYNKFLKIADKELGSRYFIRCVSKGNRIAVPTCHIRKKDTFYVNYGDLILLSNEPKETRGIYIDIFPLENSSDIKVVRDLNGMVCLGIQFAMSCITVKHAIKYIKAVGVSMEKDEKKSLCFKRILGQIFGMIPIYNWCKFYDKFAAKKNDNSKYVTSYTGYKNLKKSTYERKKVVETCKGEFEGRIWNLPKDYDYYLSLLYNDYMKIPDPKYQKVHPIFELQFSDKKI